MRLALTTASSSSPWNGPWPRVQIWQGDADTTVPYAQGQLLLDALKKAGVHKGSNRLQPTSAATTVRVANGKSQVQDGPYIDSKEQIAGYYLIDVPDLDAAISWAARCPTASHGAVEVRPVWAMPASASSAA